MPTYTPLESIVLTSSTSSLTFSNISQNYQDLVIVGGAISSSDISYNLQFNGDTSSNYSTTYLLGSGSAASSGRLSNGTKIEANGRTGTNGGVVKININNYSNTTTYKTVLSGGGNAGAYVAYCAGLWRSTSAITSVTITPESGTISAGSTFDLYAISPAAANTAQASGGTEIIYTNTHVIHVFKASGTFTPTRNLTADYLVVAGGGGGGRENFDSGIGGGGGAGGLRSTVGTTGGGGSLESALSLTAGTSYTVTIGAGGAARTTGGVGNNGSNSVFSTITSTGGGGGGGGVSGNNNPGQTGGSGGGGQGDTTGINGGAGTANQGYAGGAANNGGEPGGGAAGGGGAGEAGNTDGFGEGGDGVSVSISGSSVTYGGGGGGANYTFTAGGGAGGGGAGGRSTISNGVNGTSNTGGGGGGGGNDGSFTTSGAGGSGIVIVRYAR